MTPTPQRLVLAPTQPARPVASRVPTATVTPRPSPTPWPFNIMLTPGEGPPPGTLDPRLLTAVALPPFERQPVGAQYVSPLQQAPGGVGDTSPAFPSAASSLAGAGGEVIILGASVEGRPISARVFGSGGRALLLVGGIHGGWEGNTVQLMHELTAHFEQNPADVLPGVRVAIIPVLNPDGLVRGRAAEGRFNANGVDLNRNWGCDWSPEAVWRDQPVNPGPRPFSEPETAALFAAVQQFQPAALLSYHSAAGGVFAGHCNGDHGSAALAAVLGEATGYAYDAPFSAYPVSGTVAAWADGMGIPAADVELATWTSSEFARNLPGILAVQRWLAGG